MMGSSVKSDIFRFSASDTAETDLSQSMLTVHSKSVSEIAHNETASDEKLDSAPGNLIATKSVSFPVCSKVT